MIDLSLERQKSRLSPEKVNNLASLQDFLARFTLDVTIQKTMESTQLWASQNGDSITISGRVFYPSLFSALKSHAAEMSLADLHLCIEPPLAACAASQLNSEAERVERLSFVRVDRSIVGYNQPDTNSGAAHIWDVGDQARCLWQDADWRLLQSETGYLGWESLKERSAPVADPLPAPRLPKQAANRLLRGDFQQAEIWEEETRKYLGVRYLWGGSGLDGIDCSGFAQKVYRRFGLYIPRDAREQMLNGRIVATHDCRLSMNAGDLLFFTHEDGRIGHVGISLGGWRVIHAEEPEAAIFSLDPNQADYNEYRARHFVFAKRLWADEVD